MATTEELTQLLIDWNNGDQAALDRLMPKVYQELRRIAKAHLYQQSANHQLDATALVHEAYLHLINCQNISWQNRAHFFGVAAKLMRNILVDYARNNLDLVTLDDALTSLASLDLQKSHIIELRYFGGLTIEETAEVLQISTATVSREWQLAKLWLLREISNRG